MQRILKALSGGLLSSAALVAASGAVLAADLGYKDEPVVEEARKLGITAYVAGVTDYVFRGISQTDEDPTVQGAVDLTYGIFYAGVWSSGINFNDIPEGTNVEVDFYAGVKPVWRGITFDLGVVYYYYPGADDDAAEVDYWEIKFGASKEIWTGLTLGATVYYSPDYSGELGDEWTFEGSATKTLGKWRGIDFAASGAVGYVDFEKDSGLEDYTYWNVGLTATKGAYSLDVRYWDTNLSDDESPCGEEVFQCDSRVVGTLKVSLPDLLDHREPLK